MSGHIEAPPNGVGFTVFAVGPCQCQQRAWLEADVFGCYCTCSDTGRSGCQHEEGAKPPTPRTPGVSHTGSTAA